MSFSECRGGFSHKGDDRVDLRKNYVLNLC